MTEINLSQKVICPWEGGFAGSLMACEKSPFGHEKESPSIHYPVAIDGIHEGNP